MSTLFNTDYQYTVAERFIEYVQIDTQSDPNATSFPSTEKQKNLAVELCKQLQHMGLSSSMDANGYVMATIPSNTEKNVPVICFCSHVDTAPDCSGTNVIPIVHKQYQGQPIILPDDETQVLTVEALPYLAQKIGDDIITASGTTLLGADDKAGVAIIMDLANYLVQNPEVPHGEIRILFTPDEETGRGTEKLDMEKLNAQIGYTLDGGELGDLEDETFSADGLTLTINGVIAHPGYAKGKLVNALKIAGEILAALPTNEWSPETTSGKSGFVHPVQISGIAEKASIDFIIRDFDTAMLADHEARLQSIAESIVAKHAGATLEVAVKEQYRNMKEMLDTIPQVVDYAWQAIEATGLTPRKLPIRGGTDGSRLSFMGLPCANLYTGMQGIHSKKEWVSIQDMQKAVQTLVHLVQIWEAKTL